MPPKPKLTPQQISDIRARMASPTPPTQDDLAAEYKVGRTTISAVLRGASAPSGANAADDIIVLAWAQLTPSPLNPRKTFDEAALAEFAENLAERGILQNLLVREIPGNPDQYWISAGERRWRAVGILVAQGRWDAGEPNIPCRIRTGDDTAARIDAIIENLQRVDVPVLEEAEAFLALQQAEMPVPDIARLISKTPRYVYQRIALATRLSPAVKTLLAESRISIEAARMLSGQDEDTQQSILDEYEEYGFISAVDIRYQLGNLFVPTSRAIFTFDPADPNLAIHTDENGETFFESRAQFWNLQTKAMQSRADELATEWAWSKISTPETRKPGTKSYVTDHATPKSASGAIVFAYPDGHVENRLHQVEWKPDEQDKANDALLDGRDAAEEPYLSDAAPSRPSPPQPEKFQTTPDAPKQSKPVTNGHIYHARRRKTVALRDALSQDWDVATRMVTFALLCPHNNVMLISGSTPMHEDAVEQTLLHQERIAKYLGKIKIPFGFIDGKLRQKILTHILALSPPDARGLFAAVVARHIHTSAGTQAELGDDPAVLAVAEHLRLQGNEEQAALTVIREDLNGVRKQTLLAIADDAGTPGINDGVPPGEIADAIAKHSKSYILPTLRFATTAEIEKALKFK